VEPERPARWARKVTVPGVAPTASVPLPPPPTQVTVGTQLAHAKVYDVVECIGEGGMGRIYRAYEPGMDRYVALKLLKPDMPDYVRRKFHREAVIAANFSHPNLPRVLDVGVVAGTGSQWMTMEYLRGRDLGRVIERGRQVAVPLLVDIFAQTLDALDYIHTRKIAHCDVKPDNIFVTRDSYDRKLVIVKLIDFGVCRSFAPPMELQGQIAGDPLYMAPEQTVLDGPIDGRADLYALGMSFYETLTGRHPFDPDLDAPVEYLLRMQLHSIPRPPSVYLTGGPPRLLDALDELFYRACAKDPNQRFADARAMRKAMVALLDADRRP
jgi:serine/threonine protein kinase